VGIKDVSRVAPPHIRLSLIFVGFSGMSLEPEIC
jgi:hypothetical protein